jgi:hypothetical protein
MLDPQAPVARAALWDGPWPAEDGGPQRNQVPHGLPGLRLGPGDRLQMTASRDALGITMAVMRAPDELYVLRHSLGRRPLEDPATAWVERIDPVSLAPLARSPELAAGPFWPGGMAAHANGSLHVVMGNHCHRLSAELEPLASTELPAPRPYNSFVVLPDGTLCMKDFDRGLRSQAQLVLLDPDTLERRATADLGEPSIGRLAADGNVLYVVGAAMVHRFHWDGRALERDDDWHARYLAPDGSYGWDPVIAGGNLWFLDNGAHDFVTTMRGAGVAPGPVHLIRIALADASDFERVEVSGLPAGAVTNPPVYDVRRRIAVAYDSANGVVHAFRFDGRLAPLWRRELSHSAHMVLYPETGELLLNDFKGPAFFHTRAGRAVARKMTLVTRHASLRRRAARLTRDEVVVVDIETGSELGRAAVPTVMQSVVFPAPGAGRDLYWLTMSTIARIAVA